MAAAPFLQPQVLQQLWTGLVNGLFVNTVGFALLLVTGKAQKMLTTAGCAHAFALGMLLYAAQGWRAFSVALLFLLAGSAATRIKLAEKTARGVAEPRGGRRGPENVWGSAAAGAVLALAVVFLPGRAVALRVGFVASFAAKLSDTAATEIGKAYGRTAYLATTLRRVPVGTVGAVSVEGTFAGVAGSLVIAAYAAAVGLVPARALVPCVAAAFLATCAESAAGAALGRVRRRMRWLTGEVMNFGMTAVGAALGVALWEAQRRQWR